MKKHYIFLLAGLLIGIWFLFFPRENNFTEEYRFEDIFDPRFSGELIHLPTNNHGLTQEFIITRHPIAPFPRIENQEPLPQITTGKNIFTYPLERLAFDLSVIKLRGIRHSGFPPYEVDANSSDEERITFYQGHVSSPAEILAYLQALANLEISQARQLLQQNKKLNPFIGTLENCECLVLREDTKRISGEAVCFGESGPIVKQFSTFIAQQTLFFVQEFFPEAPLPPNFDEERFVSGSGDACQGYNP